MLDEFVTKNIYYMGSTDRTTLQIIKYLAAMVRAFRWILHAFKVTVRIYFVVLISILQFEVFPHYQLLLYNTVMMI